MEWGLKKGHHLVKHEEDTASKRCRCRSSERRREPDLENRSLARGRQFAVVAAERGLPRCFSNIPSFVHQLDTADACCCFDESMYEG